MLKVYTKKVCLNCVQLKHHLDREGIEYQVVDLEEDEAAMAHVMALGLRSAPIMELGNSHYSGYFRGDPKFRELIAKAKAASAVGGMKP